MGEPLTELGPEYRTRPGTPMIGPYSVNQMDDFYAAMSRGEVKTTGVMNYIQRLLIADRCEPGARLVDVCCGRGLQLPVLYRYAPHIASYVGLDIAPGNLAEARDRIAELDQQYGGRPFEIELIECDVSEPWPNLAPFDVAVYTSALEHLPRVQAIASLQHLAFSLAPGGWLYLSTPNSPGDPPRQLQHRVHVYEWNAAELTPLLEEAGLRVCQLIGLLPPTPGVLAEAVLDQYGTGALALLKRLQEVIPPQFLDAVTAAAAPQVASELMYVCGRR